MALGLQRLFTGRRTFVGADYIRGNFEDLDVPERTIELDGTLGPPDFRDDSYRHVNASLFCFEKEGRVATLRKDVLIYREMDFGLSSQWLLFPCFPGFFP